MKKFSITALVTMLFVLLLAVSVFAEDHKHCVCGENAVGATAANGHTCDKAQVWTEWTTAGKLPTTSGYYYLTSDITLTGSQYPATDAKIFICLNGHKIDQNGQTSCYRIYKTATKAGCAGADISICCCKGTGIIDAGSKQDDNDGGVFWVQNGAEESSNFYFYNITIDASKRNVVVPNDSNKKGGTKGAILDLEQTAKVSSVNIYDGTYIGGTAFRGGAFSVSGKVGTLAKFNMYGGTIKDGKATVTKYSTNTAVGGNVFLSGCEANLVAGTIQNGTAIKGTGLDSATKTTPTEYASNGGNIGIISDSVVKLSKDFVVTGGKDDAETTGDIFLWHTEFNGVYVESGTVPSTGDATTIVLWVAVLACAAMGFVALSKKKAF